MLGIRFVEKRATQRRRTTSKVQVNLKFSGPNSYTPHHDNMPPRIQLLVPRRLTLRTKPLATRRSAIKATYRFATDDAVKGPVQENPGAVPSGASESHLPHVTEEQAALDKVMGEVPPQTEEQSTPIQEVRRQFMT
jgi:hypothetical protein